MFIYYVLFLRIPNYVLFLSIDTWIPTKSTMTSWIPRLMQMSPTSWRKPTPCRVLPRRLPVISSWKMRLHSYVSLFHSVCSAWIVDSSMGICVAGHTSWRRDWLHLRWRKTEFLTKGKFTIDVYNITYIVHWVA